MQTTIDALKIGQRGTILEFDIDTVPLKLLEMGCLPGNEVRVLQIAPLGDPLYLDVNGSHLAIRIETARNIQVETES